MRKFIILMFLFYSAFVWSQMSRKEIDHSFLVKINNLRTEGKYKEIIEECKSLIKYSRSIGYNDGIIEGYATMGDYYIALGNYQESIKSLETAENLAGKSNNFKLKALIAIAFGRNYNEQNISQDLAIKKLRQGVELASKIEDKTDRDRFSYYACDQLVPAYYNSNKPDSAVYFIHKNIRNGGDLFYLNNELAHYHITYTKNADSALFYLKKSEHYPATVFMRSVHLQDYGDYFLMLKQYKKAEEKYKEALGIAEKSTDIEGVQDALSALKKLNQITGNKSEELYYSQRYLKISDSLKNETKESTKDAVNYIVKSQEEKLQHEKTRKNQIIILLTVLGFVSTLLGIIIIYRLKNKNKLLFREKEEKNILISQKEKETKILHQKINEAFDEVVMLAKANSPEFFTRFREVYPEAVNKLLEINPKLTIPELTLCAYIFLGFTTKDIMNITFTSINTVKSRKYYLRKKLNIPAESTTEMWIKNIGEKS